MEKVPGNSNGSQTETEVLPPVRSDQSDLPFPSREAIHRDLMSGVHSALNSAGMTVTHIANVLVEASKANRVVTASYQGRILDEKSYADHPTRMEAVMHGAKLHGLLVDRKELDIRKQTIIYRSGINREPLPD